MAPPKAKSYSNFCSKCGIFYNRLKKKSKMMVCINCYKGPHNLRDNYPENEIREFLSTIKDGCIVGDEGKVYKVNSLKNNGGKERLATIKDGRI
jgi:hypothetical protein